MKKTIIIVLNIVSFCLYGQVGINTDLPKSTLDIVDSKNVDKADGLILPRFTATELNAKNLDYNTAQYSALVYVTSGVGMVGTKTQNISGEGFYFYDAPNTVWQKLNVGNKTEPAIGTVKYSLQDNDHNGWVKLNGQAVTLLPTMQRTNAVSLGFISSLPDAENTLLIQRAGALGNVSGNNSIYISKAMLPNVNLTSQTNSTGAHTHTYLGANAATTNTSSQYGGQTRSVRSGQNTSSAGEHTHTPTTVSLNGGVTQQPIQKMPQSLSVNVFVYLGN